MFREQSTLQNINSSAPQLVDGTQELFNLSANRLSANLQSVGLRLVDIIIS